MLGGGGGGGEVGGGYESKAEGVGGTTERDRVFIGSEGVVSSWEREPELLREFELYDGPLTCRIGEVDKLLPPLDDVSEGEV